MRKLTRAQKSMLSRAVVDFVEDNEVDLSRHRRICDICQHPACNLIQEAFLQWRSPLVIMKQFNLKSRTTIYHHAHAFRLFDLRDRTLRFALGHIIEEADRVHVTAQDVIRAAYAFAHINEEGLWIQPATKSEVVVSANRPASPPLASQPAYGDSSSEEPRVPTRPTSRRRRTRLSKSLREIQALQPPPPAPPAAPEPAPQAPSARAFLIATNRNAENDATG